MLKNNIVVYTQRVEIIASYNERRDCADQRIAEYLNVCGFLPVPLPNNADLAEAYIESIKPSGIVLTGGNSLCKYGGNAPERDAMDKRLIELAIDKNIPLYGFCRGMQSILDYFGCELVNVTGHVAVRHIVSGEEDGEKNSYHNQACLKLKDDSGLEITAKTNDGVIEAVRHKEYKLSGTMWHPERNDVFEDSDIQRIQNLFNR